MLRECGGTRGLSFRDRLTSLGLMEMSAAELAAPALVLAPHPDDETLGCGGTIARKRRAGARVHVAFLTDGGASHARFLPDGRLTQLRRAEATEACAALGVPEEELTFLGHADGALSGRARAAGTEVAALAGDLGPAQVLAPCPWEVWPDHLAAASIGASVAEDAGAALLGYPIWFWDRWPWTPTKAAGRIPLARTLARAAVGHWRLWRCFRVGVPLGDAAEDKRAALQCHRTQTVRLVDDPDWPVLAEVAGGRLLPMLLGDLEVFAPAAAGRPSP